MTTVRHGGVLATACMSLVLLFTGCSKSAETPSAGPAAPSAATGASPTAQSPAQGGDLAALVPAPANTVTAKGPDPIADNGIHRYFEVNGAPEEVMNAFKTELQGKGWEVSTLNSSRHGDGGGATLSGTNGAAYGVFNGGGYKSTTYLDVCLWPAKPANPGCDHGSGR